MKNLGYLLSINDGNGFCRFRKNPFNVDAPKRLTVLKHIKEPNLQPLRMMTGRNPQADVPRHSPGWAGRVEWLGLKVTIGALAITLLACGTGALHMAHRRPQLRISQQLRKNEQELHKMTLAYRSLSACVAMQVATTAPQGTMRRVIMVSREPSRRAGTRS